MGAIIFIILALWFLTENFPEVFGFIGVIFSFLWDLVGNFVMFFVHLFDGIFSFVAGTFGGAVEWLMNFLGGILSPVLDTLPDTPLVPLALVVLLGVLFVILKDPNDQLGQSNIDVYAKLAYAWCATAFNLGMIIAGSGHPFGWMSGAIDVYIIDTPMTMLNYAQWDDFAKTMLILTLIGGLILSVIFSLAKGLRSFLRTWVGLLFCIGLGYGYMIIRLTVSRWLDVNLGFIGSLLNIPIGFVEFIILIQYFFGIIVFLLPTGAIRAINAMNSEAPSHYNEASVNAEDIFDESDSFDDSFPVYVSDDEGNHYSVSHDGDFIFINLPNGRISTKWEYIKGNPYFDLQGKRFYPHS